MEKENIIVVYGSGASFGSGYRVKFFVNRSETGIGNEMAPPTDKQFFKDIGGEILEKKFPALQYFKALYLSNNDVGMEEVWSAIDLNYKHICLDTYNWEEETDKYKEESRRIRISGEGNTFDIFTDYPSMDILSSHIRSNGMFTTSPQYNKYKFLGDCGRDFRRLVCDVYSRYDVADTEDCFAKLDKIIYEAESAKDSKFKFLGYLTFNYDCFLEESLSRLARKFKYIGSNFVVDSFDALIHGDIPIIKLHGSLSWEERREGISHLIRFHDQPYLSKNQINPEYDNDNKWIQPAIIPPTIFKQEINDDSRVNNPLTQVILQQWRSAITILQEADTIIIIGYSFPESDFHAHRIFQISSMIRRRTTKPPVKVLYCAGPEDDEKKREGEGVKRKNMLKRIFGNHADINITYGFDKLLQSNELKYFLRP